jgi:hypothetical protein
VDISGISPTPHAACCPVLRFSEEENDVGCACLFRFASPLGIGHPGPPVGRRLPWLEANALPFPAGGGGAAGCPRGRGKNAAKRGPTAKGGGGGGGCLERKEELGGGGV